MPASEISYPGASLTQPFVAKDPYVLRIMSADVKSGVTSRTYDFSGDVPFINPTTGLVDPATLQAWDKSEARSRTLPGADIPAGGFPGRVDKRGGFTMVRYLAWDGVTAGKCRTQVNSYPIPPRTRVRWEFEVGFGSDDGENRWVLTPPGESPVLFWQVKSTVPGNPSMSAIVDTDPNDPNNSLVLIFLNKGGKSATIKEVGRVHGIPRHSVIPISIESFLDERATSAGGKGRMKVWVLGQPVADVVTPTLTWGEGTHNWAMAMYLYDEPIPYRYTRASFWKTARMYVHP